MFHRLFVWVACKVCGSFNSVDYVYNVRVWHCGNCGTENGSR